MAVDARRWLAIGLAVVASTLVWLAARDELTMIVGRLARSLVALAGYEAYDTGTDALAIVVARTAGGALVRGTTLERWHVNLIALPVLVVAFGPTSWRPRLALGVGAVTLVLVCDALSAIAFVALQGWGASGDAGALVDPAQRQVIRATAMRALAVYGSKLVPLAVVGLLLACRPQKSSIPEEP